MTAEELKACYLRYHRRLYLVALAVTADRQRAEDAVHDAFEKLLRSRPVANDLLAYVTRAVHNAAIDICRRRGSPDAVAVELQAVAATEPIAVSASKLGAALAGLSPDERETIWLHIYADLSFREIAGLRERPLNTVTSWYRRGLERLRGLLGETHERD